LSNSPIRHGTRWSCNETCYMPDGTLCHWLIAAANAPRDLRRALLLSAQASLASSKNHGHAATSRLGAHARRGEYSPSICCQDSTPRHSSETAAAAGAARPEKESARLHSATRTRRRCCSSRRRKPSPLAGALFGSEVVANMLLCVIYHDYFVQPCSEAMYHIRQPR